MQELWIQVSWNKVGEGENEEKTTNMCLLLLNCVCYRRRQRATTTRKVLCERTLSRFISLESTSAEVSRLRFCFLAFSCVHYFEVVCCCYLRAFSTIFFVFRLFALLFRSVWLCGCSVFRLNRNRASHRARKKTAGRQWERDYWLNFVFRFALLFRI